MAGSERGSSYRSSSGPRLSLNPASFPGWRGHRPRTAAKQTTVGGKVTRGSWGGDCEAGSRSAPGAAYGRKGRVTGETKIGHGQGWPPASEALDRGTGAGLPTTAPGLAAQPLYTRGRDRGRADGGTAPGPSSSLVPKPRAATAAARGRQEAPPWSRETSLSGRAERREKGCRLGRAHGRGAGERRGALGEPREPEESRPTGQASRGPRPAPVCHAALAQPQRRGRAGGGQVRTSLGRASERRAPRGCPNPGPESTR